jgi:branched-chain amino acid transport system ATP-binding protein
VVTSRVDNQSQLKIEDLHLSFGGVKALMGVSLEVNRGEIYAIIGPNGAGKTSLLNCINRFYKPERGKVFFEGEEISKLPAHQIAERGIARTFQNVELFKGMTVLDNIKLGRHVRLKTGILSGGLYFGKAQREEMALRKEVEERIIDLLEIEAIRKKVVGTLPYGLQKRVELGRALALEPQILLLDEPMTGMNLEEVEDMARFVLDVNEEWGTTVVLIEHDMGVVMDISQRVCALDFGVKIAEGTPLEVRANEQVIKAYLGEEDLTHTRKAKP